MGFFAKENKIKFYLIFDLKVEGRSRIPEILELYNKRIVT